MHTDDYFATIETLMGAQSGNPSQADVRKAISTSYYAAFYALCHNTADCFIGAGGDERCERAWRQAFRAVDHGIARRQCQNQQVMAGFPPEIRLFANNFISLQEKRHVADYDPSVTFDIDESQNCLHEAKQAVAALAAASEKDRRDFAAWVALRHRP